MSEREDRLEALGRELERAAFIFVARSLEREHLRLREGANFASPGVAEARRMLRATAFDFIQAASKDRGDCTCAAMNGARLAGHDDDCPLWTSGGHDAAKEVARSEPCTCGAAADYASTGHHPACPGREG